MSPETTSLEVDVLTELLDSYRRFPCLWDTSHPLYMNRDIKQVAYQALLDIFKKIQPDATMETLKRKMDSLRGSYRRERKKNVFLPGSEWVRRMNVCISARLVAGGTLHSSQHMTLRKNYCYRSLRFHMEYTWWDLIPYVIARESAGSDQVYMPKLWFYENMSFLSEKTQVPGGTETEEEDDTVDTPLTDTGEPGDQPKTSIITQPTTHHCQPQRPTAEGPPIKKLRTPVDVKPAAMLDASPALLPIQDTETDIIGRSLAVQLQKLDEIQRAIAEKLFAEVIFHGKMNQLTPCSSINLNPSQETPPVHFISKQYSPSSSSTSSQRHLTPQPAPSIPERLISPFENSQQVMVAGKVEPDTKPVLAAERFQQDSTQSNQSTRHINLCNLRNEKNIKSLKIYI